MKKLLLAAAVAAVTFGASAKDWTISTFDMTKAERSKYQYGNDEKDQLSGTWTADDGTVFNYVLKQANSTTNADNIAAQETQLRWYKDYELTITAPATVGSIKQIEITASGATYTKEFTAEGTVCTISGKTLLWKHETGVNPFIGVATGGQIRVAKMVISDAVGDEPELPEVPALPETAKYDNIAAWLAAADNSKPSQFNNPVTVVYQKGASTYVQDATGSMLIYGTIPTYTPGQQIPAGFVGTYTDYFKRIELSLPKIDDASYAAYFATFKPGVDGAAVTPAAVEVSAINGETMGNKYVKLTGVKISDISNNDFTITQGTATVAGYNSFGITVAPTEGEKTVDIIGIIDYYQPKNKDPRAAIYPIEIIGETTVVPTENTKVANIAAFLAGKDTNVTYEFENPVTVVYKNGNNTYVQDATGSMLIFGTTPAYTNGQQIPAGFVGKYVDFNSTIELSVPNNDEAKATYKEGIDGPAVEPVTVTAADILAKGEEWGNKYVRVAGVKISDLNTDAKSFNINEGTTVLPGYLKFSGITVEETAADKTVDIVGVISIYKKAVQLYPISVNETVAIGEVSADNDAPVEYFNLQGVRVANPEGGLFIMRQGNKVAKVIR